MRRGPARSTRILLIALLRYRPETPSRAGVTGKVVAAPRILDAAPSVIQVVPLTATIRSFHSGIVVESDRANGLDVPSAAQCQYIRAVSPSRIAGTRGNVGITVLGQIRETIAVLLDLP